MTLVETKIKMLKSEANRSQEWVPFVTQQQRLRNLVQIVGYNLFEDAAHNTSFYYTLHLTTMCAPFYTSENICSHNPKWTKIDICNSIGAAKAVIIRLWKTLNGQSKVLFVWAIELSGLLYISPMPLEPKMFNANSLVFCMTGGNYTVGHCIKEDQPTLARITVLTLPAKDVKISGTLSQLSRIHNMQLLANTQRQAATALKDKIMQGEISRNNNKSDKYHSATLRRLMNQENVQKLSRQSILELKKEIELGKFRVMLLNQEKARKIMDIRLKTENSKTLYDENVLMSDKLVEMNESLHKESQELKKMNAVCNSMETLSLNNQLSYRKKQLVSELNYIYPIIEVNGRISISNVHLPNSENFDGCNDIQLSVALGFVAHLIYMISYFFDVPLRYPIELSGSRCKIIDNISLDMDDKHRMFPLFGRTRNRLEFNYAVYLLNKNIAQLRWFNGYLTNDLRATLQNCSVLLQPHSSSLKLQSSKLTSSNSSLDSSINAPPRFAADGDDTSSDDSKTTKTKHSNSDPSISEDKAQRDFKNDFHSS